MATQKHRSYIQFHTNFSHDSLSIIPLYCTTSTNRLKFHRTNSRCFSKFWIFFQAYSLFHSFLVTIYSWYDSNSFIEFLFHEFVTIGKCYTLIITVWYNAKCNSICILLNNLFQVSKIDKMLVLWSGDKYKYLDQLLPYILTYISVLVIVVGVFLIPIVNILLPGLCYGSRYKNFWKVWVGLENMVFFVSCLATLCLIQGICFAIIPATNRQILGLR